MSKKYVEFDHKTNSVLVSLPPEYEEYKAEVLNAMTQAFAYEAITVPVVEQMNTFIVEWFKNINITLK